MQFWTNFILLIGEEEKICGVFFFLFISFSRGISTQSKLKLCFRESVNPALGLLGQDPKYYSHMLKLSGTV